MQCRLMAYPGFPVVLVLRRPVLSTPVLLNKYIKHTRAAGASTPGPTPGNRKQRCLPLIGEDHGLGQMREKVEEIGQAVGVGPRASTPGLFHLARVPGPIFRRRGYSTAPSRVSPPRRGVGRRPPPSPRSQVLIPAVFGNLCFDASCFGHQFRRQHTGRD